LESSNTDAIQITQNDTTKYLHDSGFDVTGRYFQVATNVSSQMLVTQLDRHSGSAVEQGIQPPTMIVIGREVALAAVLLAWQTLPVLELRPAIHA